MAINKGQIRGRADGGDDDAAAAAVVVFAVQSLLNTFRLVRGLLHPNLSHTKNERIHFQCTITTAAAK